MRSEEYLSHSHGIKRVVSGNTTGLIET
jgi:hypothetical protein